MRIVGEPPKEKHVHALINLPTWDGKIVLAGIFILGYYGLVFAMVLGTTELAQTKADIVRDAMLTLGPPIGIIIGALFRSTGAEERREALRSNELTTAIQQPTAAANGDTGDQVEQGARKGAREGVAQGMDGTAGDRDPWETTHG